MRILFFLFLFVFACQGCTSSNTSENHNDSERVDDSHVDANEVFTDSLIFKMADLKPASKKDVDLVIADYFDDEFLEFLEMNARRDVHSYFYTLDLNNDDKLDLIYCGPSGGEPEKTVFFLRRNGRFVEVFTEYQFIESLLFINGVLHQVVLFDPGCCAEEVSQLKTFQFLYYSDKFTHEVVLNQLTWGNPQMSNLFKKPKRFRVKSNPYFLRSSPEINNDSTDIDLRLYGNILGKLKSGDEGTAIAWQKDNENREWWYVYMDVGAFVEGSGYDYYFTHYKKISAGGWLSSRYLEVLD